MSFSVLQCQVPVYESFDYFEQVQTKHPEWKIPPLMYLPLSNLYTFCKYLFVVSCEWHKRNYFLRCFFVIKCFFFPPWTRRCLCSHVAQSEVSQRLWIIVEHGGWKVWDCWALERQVNNRKCDGWVCSSGSQYFFFPCTIHVAAWNQFACTSPT